MVRNTEKDYFWSDGGDDRQEIKLPKVGACPHFFFKNHMADGD
jgi:hypothetical protein